MEIIKKIQAFISYWYLRYLLVTEMYMVEPWEKAVIRILFKNIKSALFEMFGESLYRQQLVTVAYREVRSGF